MLTILLAESRDRALANIRLMLEKTGCDLHVAPIWDTGCRLFERARPDVVITDQPTSTLVRYIKHHAPAVPIVTLANPQRVAADSLRLVENQGSGLVPMRPVDWVELMTKF